jgi:hypothetical protein
MRCRALTLTKGISPCILKLSGVAIRGNIRGILRETDYSPEEIELLLNPN